MAKEIRKKGSRILESWKVRNSLEPSSSDDFVNESESSDFEWMFIIENLPNIEAFTTE